MSHGFFASPYVFNATLLSLPWFYHRGYDVLLVTLPFHGRRRGRLDPYSGHGFLAKGPKHLNEAMMQCVADTRSWMDWLFERGVDKIGMTGLSLGGHTTALVAAADDRLSFAVPNAAATHLPSLLADYFPLNRLLGTAIERYDTDLEELTLALEATSPLTRG